MVEPGTKKRALSKGKKVETSGDAKRLKVADGSKAVKGKSKEGSKKAESKLNISDKDKTPKARKKLEVTAYYAELIDPGRNRDPEDIVADIFEIFNARDAPLPDQVRGEVGSKVIQACLKWGSAEQRKELLTKLKDFLPKMSTDRHGHVVVRKLLRYTIQTAGDRVPNAEEKKARVQNMRTLLDCFTGKALRQCFYQRYGCQVLNALYFSEAVSSKDRRRIISDLAVPISLAVRLPEIFNGTKPLRELIRTVTEEQRTAIKKRLLEAVETCVEKELLAVDLVHLLFQAYCGEATEQELRSLAEKCIAGVPHMLSSKPGAEAAMRLLGVANAKERKNFCRDLKGKFTALATNAVDYVVTMRLAATVDDTVLTGKGMVSEWVTDLETVCFDKYGGKAVAWILKPDDKRIFTPYERECVAFPAPTSLKDPDTRRQELLRILKPPMRSLLVSAGTALRMCADASAKDVLFAFLAADWDTDVIEALLTAAEADAKTKDFGELANGTAIKALLELLKLEPQEASDLSLQLWKRVLSPHLIAAAGGSRCCFLLTGLLANPKVGAEVSKALKKQKKAIQSAIKEAENEGANVAGAQKLLAALDKQG